MCERLLNPNAPYIRLSLLCILSSSLCQQDQWENQTVWQIVIQFSMENATWLAPKALRSIALPETNTDQSNTIDFFSLAFNSFILNILYCCLNVCDTHKHMYVHRTYCNTSVVFSHTPAHVWHLLQHVSSTYSIQWIQFQLQMNAFAPH